jgi:hypothetical protein
VQAGTVCISYLELFAYKSFLVQAFLCIALLIGDGSYNFFKVIIVTLNSIREKSKRGRLNRGKVVKLIFYFLMSTWSDVGSDFLKRS